MVDSLDLHPASDEERVQGYRNVHSTWGQGASLEEFLEQRRVSPRHNRAGWFVGTIDGRVVTSLAAYPMEFWLHGEVHKGISIGSVYTVAEFRRRGFARRLLKWVEENRRAAGVTLSVLYSEIDPTYYENGGYILCSAWAGWRNVAGAESSDGVLVPFQPAEHLERLSELYDGFHAARPFAVARSMEYWEFLLRREPEDAFYFLNGSGVEALGFVRLAVAGDTLKIRDLALAVDTEELRSTLLAAVVDEARKIGARRVGGWLPMTPSSAALFNMEERRESLTMVKAIEPSVAVDDAALEAAAHFCDADYV